MNSKGLALLAVFLCLVQATASAASVGTIEKKIEADRLLKKGWIEKAIPLYEEVIRENKRFSNAYYNLATAYYLEGDLEKAVQNLEAFLRIEPLDIEARYNLGCLKLRMGKFEEAQKHFQWALDGPSRSSLFLPKIKEALLLLKDLHNQNPQNRQLLAYLLTGSERNLLAA